MVLVSDFPAKYVEPSLRVVRKEFLFDVRGPTPPPPTNDRRQHRRTAPPPPPWRPMRPGTKRRAPPWTDSTTRTICTIERSLLAPAAEAGQGFRLPNAAEAADVVVDDDDNLEEFEYRSLLGYCYCITKLILMLEY